MSIASEIQRLQTAKADIKSAIEGKGVTVPVSATLEDYPDLIDSISGGGGGSVQFNSGSFTGDQSVSAILSVGFEPDVVIIDADLDIDTAGWNGLRSVVIIKNSITINCRHNNDTTTSANYSGTTKLGGEYPAYGSNNDGYCNYATYSNGVLTVTNATNHAIVQFINGQTYNWYAFKYTS